MQRLRGLLFVSLSISEIGEVPHQRQGKVLKCQYRDLYCTGAEEQRQRNYRGKRNSAPKHQLRSESPQFLPQAERAPNALRCHSPVLTPPFQSKFRGYTAERRTSTPGRVSPQLSVADNPRDPAGNQESSDVPAKPPGHPPQSELLWGREVKQVRQVVVQVLLNTALNIRYYRLDRGSKK